MDSRTVYTRAYPNPNPPEIVDNPERILRKYPTPGKPTIIRSIYRANSAPEHFIALSYTHFDLELPSGLPRTKSFSALYQTNLELPISPSHNAQHIRDRETPPSTPPSIHFIQNLGIYHPKSV